MNILFITHALTGGGAERVCVSVANGLSDLGHNVHILTGAISNHDYPVDKNVVVTKWGNVKTTQKSVLKLFGRSAEFCRVTKIFSEYIKRNSIDVVVNILGCYFTETLLACKLTGAKMVFSDHNSYERPKDAPMRGYQKRHKFYESRLCDMTTVLTNRDREILKSRRNVVVMPNPLFVPVKTEIPHKEKIVLAIGRVDVWYVKGFDLLIKAWAQVCHEQPDWKLVILGKSNERSKNILQQMADENNVINLEFQDFTQNVVDEYSKSEIFVLSSRYEGFGLVLTEAMSQRCACIACDYLTRQKDIITNGVDGLLCENNNVDSIAEKLRLLISDENLRHSLQEHSIDNLERFSEINIAKKWECLLQSILN